MKKNIPKSSTAKHNFLAAATHVIPLVSLFGENLIARLMGGEVVSYTEEFCEVADVFMWDTSTSIQVKMCNRKHAQRPTARQIDRLYVETRRENKPFIAEIHQGLYAFVFYDGVQNRRETNGKSKLLSRKNSNEDKFEIIAQEIQCIYIVEIDLLHHISKSEAFTDVQRFGECKVHAQRKACHYRDRLVLYLTRGFFLNFLGEIPKKFQKALNRSFGKGGWCVETTSPEINFKNATSLKRAIPVTFIGRPKTLGLIEIKSKVTFNINNLKT